MTMVDNVKFSSASVSSPSNIVSFEIGTLPQRKQRSLMSRMQQVFSHFQEKSRCELIKTD